MTSSFTVYLARHGETEYNRKRLMQGRSIDAPLNERGIRQAEALAKRMVPVQLDTVYASALLRARQTAERVVGGRGLNVTTLPDLAEMSWGSLEGRPISELRAHLREVGADWRAGHFDFAVGGGESILDVQNRAQSVLDHLMNTHSAGQNIMVVTHGRFLRVLLATALPETGLTRMDDFPHANCGLYRMEGLRDGTFTLTLRNETGHLEHLSDAA
ncbi:MAG: histidine phosphatase family protein [Rhodothermales bacterium]|nr:histidine phosphatase family protein [Rhodothermales bacterium]MBO6779597.1 histidine phosphatase family protein [Rhodothermales bacterium]